MKPQKTRVVKRFLTSQGWELLRTGKGSHELWGDPTTGDRLSLPAGHGEASPGVLRQLQVLLPNIPEEWT